MSFQTTETSIIAFHFAKCGCEIITHHGIFVKSAPEEGNYMLSYHLQQKKRKLKLELDSIKPPGAGKLCFSRMGAKRLNRRCPYSIGFEPVHPKNIQENTSLSIIVVSMPETVKCIC